MDLGDNVRGECCVCLWRVNGDEGCLPAVLGKHAASERWPGTQKGQHCSGYAEKSLDLMHMYRVSLSTDLSKP